MRVLLIGATGLVGGLLADRLLQHGADVHALTRRPTGRATAGWREHVAEADRWPETVAGIEGAAAAVSCLGTTWRKAGSEQAFRAVDHDAVIAFARAAKKKGVPHFVSVSSVGADAGSRNFYLRTKGETDQALATIGFHRLDIFRPGLLLGARGGDRRPGERIAIALDPLTRLLLRGRAKRFAGIPAAAVAAAIVAVLEQGGNGTHLHGNESIVRLHAR